MPLKKMLVFGGCVGLSFYLAACASTPVKQRGTEHARIQQLVRQSVDQEKYSAVQKYFKKADLVFSGTLSKKKEAWTDDFKFFCAEYTYQKNRLYKHGEAVFPGGIRDYGFKVQSPWMSPDDYEKNYRAVFENTPLGENMIVFARTDRIDYLIAHTIITKMDAQEYQETLELVVRDFVRDYLSKK